MKLQPRTRSNRRASSASFKSELNKLVENAKMGLIEQKFDTIASMVLLIRLFHFLKEWVRFNKTCRKGSVMSRIKDNESSARQLKLKSLEIRGQILWKPLN